MQNDLAEIRLKVRNKAGLHMRAATLFVKEASRFPCKVTVEKNGEAVDGKSIISLMTLGVEKGSELRIVAEGRGAQQVVGKLQKLIDDKFGEE
jgi:phosphocarrier protein